VPVSAVSMSPFLVAYRMGKRSLDMAKQFAFQQTGRGGAAVDDDKRVFPGGAQPVNLIGDAFFAHTAFAEDQDVDAASGHLFYQAVQIFHGRTLVIFIFIGVIIVGDRASPAWTGGHIFEFLEHQLNFFGQGFPVKWLLNIVDSPGFDGLYRIGNVSVSS
jgi:hypothetical protein